VNGNPAISYHDNTWGNEDLKFIRASDTSGTSWNAPVTVDSAENVGDWTSLCVVNEHPAISYYDWGNKDLKYVRASDTSGTSWNTPVTVDSTGDVGDYGSCLRVVNGNPAISYYDYTNGNLKYVRASNQNGGAWNTPLTFDSPGDDGMYSSLCLVDGNPAISYYAFGSGNLKYVRASDQNGTAWNTPLALDITGDVGEYSSLCLVDGNPAISYFDDTNDDLKYIRASDASGSSWNTPLTVDSSGEVGLHGSCLCVVNDTPAISYYNWSNTHLMYIQASDATGSAWNTPLVVDSSNNVGEYSSMISYGGKAYIVYYAYGASNLKFAAGSFPD
jgi:hypothetical protein